MQAKEIQECIDAGGYINRGALYNKEGKQLCRLSFNQSPYKFNCVKIKVKVPMSPDSKTMVTDSYYVHPSDPRAIEQKKESEKLKSQRAEEEKEAQDAETVLRDKYAGLPMHLAERLTALYWNGMDHAKLGKTAEQIAKAIDEFEKKEQVKP